MENFRAIFVEIALLKSYGRCRDLSACVKDIFLYIFIDIVGIKSLNLQTFRCDAKEAKSLSQACSFCEMARWATC